MAHSIAQEISMVDGMNIDEAQVIVNHMRHRVAEGDDPAEVLFENGLNDDNATWLNELTEE